MEGGGLGDARRDREAGLVDLAAFQAGGVELQHQAPFGVADVEAEEVAAEPAGGDDRADGGGGDRRRRIGGAPERRVVGEPVIVKHSRRLLEQSADRQQARRLRRIAFPVLGHSSSMPHMVEVTG